MLILSILTIGYQIISIAITKNVVTNGRINVSQGQCVMMAITNAAVEIKNNSQYKPLDLFLTSIVRFCAKIGEQSDFRE